MGKYDPLAQHLSGLSRKRTRLSYRQIEEILDDTLPQSAYRYQSWWQGNSAVWLFEGWRAIPNLRKQRVDFLKDRTAKRILANRVRPTRTGRSQLLAPRSRRSSRAASRYGQWGGVMFHRITRLEPERNRSGIVSDRPQSRYVNRHNLPLNRWGDGPFCKFKIPTIDPTPGVYILTTDRVAQYVGETENLTVRFNSGYGSISPRNCFRGGQSTNCRVNTSILKSLEAGSEVELWFAPSKDRKALETTLISSLQPPWNRK